MRRLLVTGASGNLGREVSRLAEVGWQVWGTYLGNPHVGGGSPVQLDMRLHDETLCLVDHIQPEVIIHAAASDRSPDMEASNRLAAINICQAAAGCGARLIALSSDLVYDGTCPPYSESDPPTPTSPYARVKADNERTLREYGGALIVRTSLIYDGKRDNHQASWMLRVMAEGRRVPLYVDEIRQPIWVTDLATAILELAEGDLTGILNVAGPQSLSRWEYGTALLAALGVDASQAAVLVRAAEVAPDRPRDCTLDLTKANRTLVTRIRPMKKALSLDVRETH